MKRAVLSASVAMLFVAALLLAGVSRLGGQNAAATPATDVAKTAEQVFKNIQVMKGTPADQLQPAMQFISNSLGVECEYCHVRDQFDKDDKKAKQTARSMIQMQMAINRDHFKGEREVTCNSCHHGAERPAAIPIIADEEPKRPEAPRPEAGQPALPTADQVIDKYVQAVGGAEALQKISSRVEKGTIAFG